MSQLKEVGRQRCEEAPPYLQHRSSSCSYVHASISESSGLNFSLSGNWTCKGISITCLCSLAASHHLLGLILWRFETEQPGGINPANFFCLKMSPPRALLASIKRSVGALSDRSLQADPIRLWKWAEEEMLGWSPPPFCTLLSHLKYPPCLPSSPQSQPPENGTNLTQMIKSKFQQHHLPTSPPP